MLHGSQGASDAPEQQPSGENELYLSSLHRLTLTLTSVRTMSEIAAALLAQTMAATESNAGLIGMSEKSDAEMQIIASQGTWRSPLPERLSLTSGATEILRSATPILLSTPQERCALYPDLCQSLSFLSDQGAIVLLPLAVRGEGFGCLLLCFAQEKTFTTGCRQFLEIVAAMGTAALERAWLEQEKQAEISARQEAEDMLHRVRVRAQCFFEANVVGMIHWNLDTGLITEANDAFLNMIGYTREDVRNGLLNWRELTPPDWRERNDQGVAEIRANGAALPYEKEYFRKDGSRVPILIGGTRFEGSSCEGASVIVDLTARKQAEAELKTLMDSVPAAIFVAHDRECRRITGNRAAYELLRAPVRSNVAKNAPPGERQTEYRVYQDGRELTPAEFPIELAATGREVRDVEIDLRFDDDSVRHIIGNAMPLYETNGQVRGCLGAFLDITERKEQQDRIAVLNVRLQRAIAEGHHRIKNNLQVLSALIDLQAMEAEIVPVSTLQRLQQHIRTLAALHDLLTRDATSNDSPSEMISVREAMQKLVTMLQESVGGRHIVLTCLDDVLLPVKHCSSFTLMVNEAVQNAVKHGKGDIEITIITIPRHHRMMQVAIADHGPGFAPDFDPKKVANTGLELIESMARWDLRGETRYENRASGGACVIVTFPIPQ